MKIRLLQAQILFLLSLFPAVRATVLYVGPNEAYTNILWAIGQASDGDTIIVRDGVYVQDIKISRSVVLMSENLHGAVIGDQSDAIARFFISRDSVNGVVIDGFKIVDGDQPGIIVGDGKPINPVSNCSIRNNYIQNRGSGILVAGTSRNLEISGNTITGCSDNAIIHQGDGINIIADNTLENCGAYGILLGDRQGGTFKITGNIIRNNSGNGIDINRSDILIEGNTIDANRIGITTSGGRKNIIVQDSNQITNSVDYGIMIEMGTEATIKDNNISMNGKEGIKNHGIASITGNSVNNNSEWGIFVITGSATIEGNDIKSNGIHGIEVGQEAVDTKIIDNTITGNTQMGVMSFAKLIMRGNLVDGNGDNGILLAPSVSGAEITHQNIISNNGMHEIAVDSGASVFIADNIIESNWDGIVERDNFNGIQIDGTARLERNTIRNINGAGIYVNEQSKDVIIIDRNQVSGNREGIAVSGSGTIEDNILEDNLETGIAIISPANNVDLAWNKVRYNPIGVVLLNGTTGIFLFHNIISENERGLFSAGESALRSNTIQQNAVFGIKAGNSEIDMGNAPEADSGKNAILDNGEWNFINATSDTISAFCNYWGQNNSDSIDATILDDNEDSIRGPVIFQPFLSDFNLGFGKYPVPSVIDEDEGPLWLYPNPVYENMVARIYLAFPARLYLYIVNTSGRIERSIANGELFEAGFSQIVWDGKAGDGQSVPDGIYFAIMKYGQHTCSRKIVVVK